MISKSVPGVQRDLLDHQVKIGFKLVYPGKLNSVLRLRDEYVTNFKLSYSSDVRSWTVYNDTGGLEIIR